MNRQSRCFQKGGRRSSPTWGLLLILEIKTLMQILWWDWQNLANKSKFPHKVSKITADRLQKKKKKRRGKREIFFFQVCTVPSLNFSTKIIFIYTKLTFDDCKMGISISFWMGVNTCFISLCILMTSRSLALSTESTRHSINTKNHSLVKKIFTFLESTGVSGISPCSFCKCFVSTLACWKSPCYTFACKYHPLKWIW